MKKKYLLIVIVIMVFLIAFSVRANAATRSFSFIGEPVVLNDYTDVEIINNEVVINEDTSEISNKIVFKNNSDNELVKEGTIKLEDASTGLKITDLHIVVNGLEINQITKDDNGNYKFYFKINPNEGKEINVTYKTSNSLQDAKVIKYSMDKIKGKHVDRLFFKVIMNKYDIPLVEKIWPGAYEFENNEIYTEYIDFDINNIKKEIVIKKETYNNLKYGDGAEEMSPSNKWVLDNYKDIIDGKSLLFTDEPRYEDIRSKIYGPFEEIMYYAIALNNIDNERIYVYPFNPLNDIIVHKNIEKTSFYTNKGMVEVPYRCGVMVAINYYESEEDKELYVIKDISNSRHSVEVNKPKLIKKDEYTLLRTTVDTELTNGKYGGEKFVYVNSDIDGNKIDITEEQIIDFVNMINVDLYIRKVLYDPSEEYPDTLVGYYNESSKEIARGFLDINRSIEEERDDIEKMKNGTYDWYVKPSEERIKEDIKQIEERIDAFNKSVRQFSNDTVKNNCKVPVIAECVGKVDYKSADEIRKETNWHWYDSNGNMQEEESSYNSSEGQYVVSFYHAFGNYSLAKIPVALETNEAKRLKSENSARNEETKNKIMSKINSTAIAEDKEEYIPSNGEIEKIEDGKNQKSIFDNDIKIILAGIISIIVLLLIFFIYNVAKVIKSKRG